jgi:tetratricopeptide (TPR) repeat protein
MCDRLLALNTNDGVAWSNKANALNELGRHRESLTCSESAIRINTLQSDAWLNRGVALLALGEYEEPKPFGECSVLLPPISSEVRKQQLTMRVI